VPGSPRYWELTLSVPVGAAEGLTNFLWETGALGVVEEERPGAPPELRAFFPETTPPAVLTARVSAYADGLAALGFGAVGPPRVEVLEDGGWADAWREHFRPIAVGRRFVIAPPWEAPNAGGRIVLVIEPGRAFGTGHHGSTAGCLEAIERVIDTSHAPGRALDLGTGSGILAIAMARLGVGRVLAIDEDPDAVAAATANVVRNEVTAQVECRMDDAATIGQGPSPFAPASLVVANLITAAHRRFAPGYERVVAPGGTLILGGILDAEAAEIERTLRSHGWRPAGAVPREGWSTLLFTRA
jgi:ribosomal protein L11 methyltransferase